MKMAQSALQQTQPSGKKTVWLVTLFLVIAAAGLLYVKWVPYLEKSWIAASTHSIGDSILGSPEAGASPSWSSAWEYAAVYFKAVWKAAILGIVLGSLIQVLIPSQWLLRVLGKTTFGSTAAGGLASLPGMMCTCCAAPMAVGMRKKNVSAGASLAFWIGNPVLNPAVLVFMTFVLSWKFTLLRLAFGLILTFGVSYLANRFMKEEPPLPAEKLMEEAEQAQSGSFLARWGKSLGTMLLYVVPAYVLSVLLLGAARVWLFPNVGEAAANSILVLILFAVAGMLFVIPTAAEIPIIQTFMTMGLGAGPAGALLITLPAVSLPSLLIVAGSFPKKVLAFVAGSVVLLGIAAGLIGMLIL
ncbi:permease [Metabacillus sp. KIGAM252]|uniref:Permease n=1 Tax=Metabacillus flavus TaxID=2823519 RepID=A0ABS5LA64_9BACI|nr:permease [Metabacillus flavus]MBS2967615.1 permease [Metabacillus flavus]